LNDFIRASIAANEEIAKSLEHGIQEPLFAKSEVGAGGDVSSGLDLMAERIFVKHLGTFGTIESEESGIIGSGDATIILDPIDGSSNALSLLPFYGTSVARVNAQGVLDAAVVCNLANGDLFFKVPGQPLQQGKLFGSSFHTPTANPHAEIGLFEKAYANPAMVALLDAEGLKFRAPGAIALSLAYAHSVRYVLFVGAFRIYDFAAGLALCEGLEVVVEQDYVIVSKDKTTIERIEGLIQRVKTMQEEEQ